MRVSLSDPLCALREASALWLMFFTVLFVQLTCADEPLTNNSINPSLEAGNTSSSTDFQKPFETLSKALNAKDYSTLEPYLTNDLSVGSFSGATAVVVLKQVVGNYPRHINSFVITTVQNGQNDTARVTAIFKCSDGSRQYNFLITNAGLFKQINIVRSRPAFSPLHIRGPFEAMLPFQVKDNLLFIRGTVNGITGLLFVDSGSDNMTVNRSCFTVKDQPKSGILSLDFNGAQVTAGTLHVKDCNLGSIRMIGFDVPIEDLSKLEEALGLKLLGIIGYDQLSLFEIKFNFKSQELTFYRLSDNGSRMFPYKGSWPDPEK